MVKPLTAAFKNIPMSLEEASYSLGANKVKTFKTTLLPLIKPAVIAGFIMAFMRSLSETGATLAITSNIKTIPLFIVELVGKGEISQAAFACTILFIVSIIFLVILKYNKFSKDYF
jgi:ABC-type molybdate transport system permease subunit